MDVIFALFFSKIIYKITRNLVKLLGLRSRIKKKISLDPFKRSKCATFIFLAFSIMKSHNWKEKTRCADVKKQATGWWRALFERGQSLRECFLAPRCLTAELSTAGCIRLTQFCFVFHPNLHQPLCTATQRGEEDASDLWWTCRKRRGELFQVTPPPTSWLDLTVKDLHIWWGSNPMPMFTSERDLKEFSRSFK